MGSIKKVAVVAVAVSLLATLFLFQVMAASPPQPTYGTATVDGATGDWALPAGDFFANMHRAGDLDKPVESKLYLRYDCADEILYALVLGELDVPILVEVDDVFVKIDGMKEVDGGAGGPPLPEIAFILPYTGVVPVNPAPPGGTTLADGWEASLSLAPGSYLTGPANVSDGLQVHNNVFVDGESQTSSTTRGNPNEPEIALVIQCTGDPDARVDKFFDPPKGQDGQGLDQIAIGQSATTQYSFAIEYENSDPNNPPVQLVDTVPAEFNVLTATTDAGTLNFFQTGKGKKAKSSTKITLDLPAGPQIARIDVVVETRQSPSRKQKFKPTSCGLIPVNDGAIVYEVDPATGEILRDVEGNKIVLLGPSNVLDIVAVEDPNNSDNDGDGIPNDVEARVVGTDPCNIDTDGDGLSDGDEVDIHGTDPLNADTDGDGLSDGDEVDIHGTDPLNADTDADGVPDGADACPLEGPPGTGEINVGGCNQPE